MLRTGQLPPPQRGVVAPLRHRDLARRREPRYRGPWRLPGPDFHRLAALSFTPGYVMSTSSLTSARTAGRTLRPEKRERFGRLRAAGARPGGPCPGLLLVFLFSDPFGAVRALFWPRLTSRGRRFGLFAGRWSWWFRLPFGLGLEP